jgi:hypothetical protein
MQKLCSERCGLQGSPSLLMMMSRKLEGDWWRAAPLIFKCMTGKQIPYYLIIRHCRTEGVVWYRAQEQGAPVNRLTAV